MHHFIYPSKATWISSGSRKTDGESLTEQNFGKDEILELRKEFFNLSFDYPTRVLVQFDISEISKSIEDLRETNEEIIPSTDPTFGSKFYLRLYEAEGNKELSSNYKLSAHPIIEQWTEGTGKFESSPQVKNGCSWNYRDFPLGGSGVDWTISGSSYASGSDLIATQSFSSSKPDVEMDVTNIVQSWLTSSGAPVGTGMSGSSNNGFLVKFSGSQETDSETFGHLKFFSNNTNTIYSPKLEFRWDDHKPATGSNTGNLLQLTSSGEADNYIYPIGLRESYKEDEKVKFRFGARKRYIQKSFTTSVQRASGSYIPKGSGSYSIVDKATGETVVPFDDDYTKLSVDSTSNYFTQWLKGFEPSRAYKILIKVKNNDGQEQIFDDDFEFIIRR